MVPGPGASLQRVHLAQDAGINLFQRSRSGQPVMLDQRPQALAGSISLGAGPPKVAPADITVAERARSWSRPGRSSDDENTVAEPGQRVTAARCGPVTHHGGQHAPQAGEESLLNRGRAHPAPYAEVGAPAGEVSCEATSNASGRGIADFGTARLPARGASAAGSRWQPTRVCRA